MKEITNWEIIGVYFGYPPCCIRWFRNELLKIHWVQPFPKTEHQKVFFNNGNGFVPCPKCAAKLISNGKTEASSLIKDRICSLPFPKSDYI